MIGRKDDPAFLYFPTNYRWSMGLLICLGAAPWTGVEIDEVHRVGRALEDRVGDDDAWFEEWTRMGEQDRGARPRRGDEGPQAHRRVVLHARDALLPDRRALHPSALPAQHGRLRQVGENLPGRCRPSSAIPRIEPVEVPYDGTQPAGAAGASRSGRGRSEARALHGVLRRFRRHQGAAIRLRRPRPCRARHRLPHRRWSRQRRERALPQSAAHCRDRALCHAGLRISRGAARVRSARASA